MSQNTAAVAWWRGEETEKDIPSDFQHLAFLTDVSVDCRTHGLSLTHWRNTFIDQSEGQGRAGGCWRAGKNKAKQSKARTAPKNVLRHFVIVFGENAAHGISSVRHFYYVWNSVGNIKLSKTQKLSYNSWTIGIEKINAETFDLGVKNPNKIEIIDERTPNEIISEIESIEKDSAIILKRIKSLL